jgi:hypothetical protein
MKRAVFALIASLLVVGCEDGSPTQPSLVQVGGLWTGSVRLTSVIDGECVGPTLAPSIGTTQVSMLQITQNSGDLTATATETSTGINTNYSGMAGSNIFTLNATSPNTMLGFLCSDGQRRDVYRTVSTINASVSGNSGNGTAAEAYTVFLPATPIAVGILNTSGTFTMTR